MTKFRLGFIIGLFALSFSANADEPSIVVDNTPEKGIPAEALAQQNRKPTALEEALMAKGEIPIKFTSLTDGTIKSVRIRYFNSKIWATEKDVREYVAGMLKNKASEAFRFQIWSQGTDDSPEIECIVEFTEEHRKKLFADNKACAEGRLLIWDTRCCYRDATGTWSFVTLFDQFHRSHPKGDRRLVKEAKPK
jgi:hypothetical protein